MIQIHKKGKSVFVLMALVALLTAVPLHSALAALVATDAAMGPASGQDARERLAGFLARAEVRAAIIAQGIDPLEAEARVAGLTDAEALDLADQIERLPAAGDGFGFAIGILLIVLLVLVILRVAGRL